MADHSEWISFEDDDDDNQEKQPPLLDKPTEKREFLSSEEYISVLENKLRKVKGEDPSKLSAKDLLEGVRLARESQLERMMNNDGQTCDTAAAFIMDEKPNAQITCYSTVYNRIFPKQPINSQELECLVDDLEPEDEKRHDELK